MSVNQTQTFEMKPTLQSSFKQSLSRQEPHLQYKLTLASPAQLHYIRAEEQTPHTNTGLR